MTSYFSSVEWNRIKAAANVRKHGVTSEEAETVFDDPCARVLPDTDHLDSEERFVILGLSSKGRALLVCHCLRNAGQVLRIISARRATNREESSYWRFRK